MGGIKGNDPSALKYIYFKKMKIKYMWAGCIDKKHLD